jgi:hypothetical protein
MTRRRFPHRQAYVLSVTVRYRERRVRASSCKDFFSQASVYRFGDSEYTPEAGYTGYAFSQERVKSETGQHPPRLSSYCHIS